MQDELASAFWELQLSFSQAKLKLNHAQISTMLIWNFHACLDSKLFFFMGRTSYPFMGRRTFSSEENASWWVGYWVTVGGGVEKVALHGWKWFHLWKCSVGSKPLFRVCVWFQNDCLSCINNICKCLPKNLDTPKGIFVCYLREKIQSGTTDLRPRNDSSISSRQMWGVGSHHLLVHRSQSPLTKSKGIVVG